MSGADPALEEGWIDRELALEFPRCGSSRC